MSKVGLLVIATNKYIRFVPPLFASARRYFLRGHEVTHYCFTNGKAPRGSIQIPHEHEPWPGPTLHRYHTFLKHRRTLEEMDYLFYCDADMLFVSDVGSEVLSPLTATIHPYYYNKEPQHFDYDRHLSSQAYIAPNLGTNYFAGGFAGGEARQYLTMAEAIVEMIEQDAQIGYVAKWHDESYMNKYLFLNPPAVQLSPSYCYPEEANLPFERRLLALLKNHDEMRGLTRASSLRKLVRFIRGRV